MPRRLHIAPLCLALVALAWAQVFGLVRGYVCDCGGEVSITVADHCHGPHGVECHDEVPVEHDHDHDEELPADGTTHHHELLKETVVANQKVQTLAVPVPALMLLAELPDWTVAGLGLNSLFIAAAQTRTEEGRISRRWPQVLTRTIAMRI
jgi:hypothetical protein